MDLLKSQIDLDSFLENLDNKSTYNDIFISMLHNPTSDLLSKLVINNFSRMITDLKYLIKFKFSRLKPVIQKNISKMVILLFGYTVNIDTLIINLLRQGYTNFPVEHKYFKEFKNALPYIKLHNGDNFATSSLSTLITFEMETDIIFMSTVENNIEFYAHVFLKKYQHKTQDILRFLKYKKFTGKNIEYIINCIKKILGYETLVEFVDDNIENINTTKEKEVKDNNLINLEKKNTQDILMSIADLSFPKYYAIIQNMKINKCTFIHPSKYKDVVFSSFEYDNYVQVYLWKILIYQKILFDIEIEIEESDLKTEEALEGYDIYLNIH